MRDSESPKPRVLFVEDEETLRDHLARVLSDEYNIETAANGEQALRAVLRQRPDVVVTDIVMPRLDGIELVKTLRSTASTATIPILLISGRAGDELRIEGFELGADSYLAKPYTERELRIRIRSMLQSLEVRDAAARREERERAEHEAVTERAALLESITDAFYAVDREWRVTYANQRALDYFGKTREQLVGKNIWDAVPVGKGSVVEREYRRAMESRHSTVIELLSPLTHRWVEVHAYPTPQGLAINFRDITERKRTADEWQLHTHILQSLTEGVSVSKEDGTIVFTNAAEDRMFGYDPGELIGKHVSIQNAYPPEENERIVGEVLLQLREHGRWSGEWHNRRKDGSTFYTQSSINSIERNGERFWVCVQRDVSKEKAARQALRDSEERFRQLADSIPQMAWMARPDGHIFWFNTRWFDYTGTTLEQMQGDGWTQVHDPTVLPEVLQRFHHSLNSGEAFEMIFPLKGADGQFRRFLTRMAPLRDGAGRITLWFGTNTDVEEQSRNTDIFRTMADAAPALVWMADESKACTWFNRPWLEYTGRTLEEEYGHGWTQGIHPDDLDRCLEIYSSSFDARQAFTIEYRLCRRDGSYGWILDKGVPLFAGRHGAFSGFIGSCIDITDRKFAEQAHVQSEERYRAFVANSSEGIWRYELDPPLDLNLSIDEQIQHLYKYGVLAELNDAMARMYGYERAEELVGAPLAKTLPPDESAFEYLREIAAADYRMVDVESIERDRHGNVRYFTNSLVPVIKDGVLLRAWGTQRDITDRKRAEELLKQNERRKDEFLSILAHELRNPMAPIRNGLQILRLRASVGAAAERTIDMMDRQMTHLVRLVDDLLDVSRINTGRLELKRERVLLADSLATAIEATSVLIETHGHELIIDIRAQSLVVEADPNRLTQVFTNLLSNAAKYTDHGGKIYLTLDQDKSNAVVTIRDTGIGIPTADLDHVFDMFTQVRTHQGRATGGLGIGLALVRTFVEMHNGAVTAASEGLGRGSTFTVSLPILERQDLGGSEINSGHVAAAANIGGRRILVVDDNVDAATSLAFLLRHRGADVQTAADGGEAIERARQFAPDVIFMDIGMPKMDGLEATRRIRQLPRGRDIFIVALTGWGQEADRKRSKEAGLDYHLVKPVSPESIESALRVLNERENAEG